MATAERTVTRELRGSDAGARTFSRLADVGYSKVAAAAERRAIDQLRRGVDALLDTAAEPFSRFTAYIDKGEYCGGHFRDTATRDQVYLDFIGASPEVDAAIEEILSHEDIRYVLSRALGPHYRIAACQARTAGESSLHLHQDRPFEISLTLLLSDGQDPSGATCFLPGSHRWPQVLGSFPFLSPERLKGKLASATGRSGDAYFFLASTWHGRLKAAEPRTAIFVSFRPDYLCGEHRRPSLDTLSRLGPTLRHLFSPMDTSRLGQTQPPPPDLWEGTKISILSPWHAAIMASNAFGVMVRSYRRLRKMTARH